MALSYKSRRRWALIILVVGLPIYIIVATSVVGLIEPAVNIVPPCVENHPIAAHRRMPFIGLVRRQIHDVRPVVVHRV